jgi:hypothetical protein
LHVYENETNEKGQPGPPNLARGDQEEWEHRVVPTITDLSWIPDGLRNVYDAKKYEVGWTGAFTLPQPWLDMIAYNRWATIG